MSHKALISAEIAKRQSKRALKFLNEHGLEVPLSFVQEMTAIQWGFRTFQGLLGSCCEKSIQHCPSLSEPYGQSYSQRWVVTEQNLNLYRHHPAFIFDMYPVVSGCECWEFFFDRGQRKGSVTIWPDGKAAIWFGNPTPVSYGTWNAISQTIILQNGIRYYVDGRADASQVKVEVRWNSEFLGIQEDQMDLFSLNFISVLEAQFVGLDCIFEPSEHCSHGVGDKSFKDQAPEPLKDNVYHAISAARRSTLACEDLVASKTR